MTGFTFKLALMKNRNLRATVEKLDSPVLNRQTKEQDKYIHESKKTAVMISKIIIGTFTATCCLWTSFVILGKFYGRRILPRLAWYYFDTSAAPNFEIMYSYQVFYVWISAIMNGSLDSLIAGLMAHAGGQLEVLKDSLRKIRTRAREHLNLPDDICICQDKYVCGRSVHYETSNETFDAQLYSEIVECIVHHQAIMEFVSDIESTFTASIFSQFFTSMVAICFTAFQITVLKQVSAQFISIMIYLLSIIMQTFVYCYYGNEISLKSSTISDAVYMTEWYRFGPGVKRALWIIMERSKRPLIMTAAKMFTLSLDTFTSIMQSAYSFYAVLRQMNADN